MGLVVIAVLAVLLSVGVIAQNDLIVQTQQGKVQGILELESRSFYGIPFAAAPIGNLRWRSPQDPASWGSEVRDATKPANDCMQADDGLWFVSQSEDCLYLNVFAPLNGTNWPVMVFFYGGSFYNGGISLPVYNGRNLVSYTKDIIVVAVNYRLGAFGFLGGSDLASETTDGGNGNYGFQDQRAGLRWVAANIAAFGGNPNRVTIFGESAGSWSVENHLVFPKSAGLFHGAIMQSGAHNGAFLLTQTDAQQQYRRFQTALNCSTLACLRAISATDITTRVDIASLGDWGVTIDGVELDQDPRELLKAGRFNKVPVILGSNSDEIPAPASPLMTEAEYILHINSIFGSLAPELLRVYPASAYDKPYDALVQIYTDEFFTCPVRRNAQWMAAYIPVYTYHFSYVNSVIARFVPTLGAFHASELIYPFKFDPLLFNANDRLMSNYASAYWTNFARSTSPNIGNLNVPTIWWLFIGTETTLNIDITSTNVVQLKKAQCDVWDTVAGLFSSATLSSQRTDMRELLNLLASHNK